MDSLLWSLGGACEGELFFEAGGRRGGARRGDGDGTRAMPIFWIGSMSEHHERRRRRLLLMSRRRLVANGDGHRLYYYVWGMIWRKDVAVCCLALPTRIRFLWGVASIKLQVKRAYVVCVILLTPRGCIAGALSWINSKAVRGRSPADVVSVREFYEDFQGKCHEVGSCNVPSCIQARRS